MKYQEMSTCLFETEAPERLPVLEQFWSDFQSGTKSDHGFTDIENTIAAAKDSGARVLLPGAISNYGGMRSRS